MQRVVSPINKSNADEMTSDRREKDPEGVAQVGEVVGRVVSSCSECVGDCDVVRDEDEVK